MTECGSRPTGFSSNSSWFRVELGSQTTCSLLLMVWMMFIRMVFTITMSRS